MIIHNIMSQFHHKNMIGNIEIFIGKEYKNIHTVEIESNACTFMAAINYKSTADQSHGYVRDGKKED